MEHQPQEPIATEAESKARNNKAFADGLTASAQRHGLEAKMIRTDKRGEHEAYTISCSGKQTANGTPDVLITFRIPFFGNMIGSVTYGAGLGPDGKLQYGDRVMRNIAAEACASGEIAIQQQFRKIDPLLLGNQHAYDQGVVA